MGGFAPLLGFSYLEAHPGTASYDLFNTRLSWCPICTPLSDTSALQQGGRIYSLQQKAKSKTKRNARAEERSADTNEMKTTLNYAGASLLQLSCLQQKILVWLRVIKYL